MPHHQHVSLSGTVTHVFGHRFVLETQSGAVLGDLTPHGQHRITLRTGDAISIEGEKKPSEIKVSRVTRGEDRYDLDEHDSADEKIATDAVIAAGFAIVGQPRRKPKHFEVLGKRGETLSELHVELDGCIRKTKPADAADPKWSRKAGAHA